MVVDLLRPVFRCLLEEKEYKIPNALHLLDDFLVVVPPFDDVQKVREKFLGIFLNTWGSFIGEENQRTLYRKGIP